MFRRNFWILGRFKPTARYWAVRRSLTNGGTLTWERARITHPVGLERCVVMDHIRNSPHQPSGIQDADRCPRMLLN